MEQETGHPPSTTWPKEQDHTSSPAIHSSVTLQGGIVSNQAIASPPVAVQPGHQPPKPMVVCGAVAPAPLPPGRRLVGQSFGTRAPAQELDVTHSFKRYMQYSNDYFDSRAEGTLHKYDKETRRPLFRTHPVPRNPNYRLPKPLSLQQANVAQGWFRYEKPYLRSIEGIEDQKSRQRITEVLRTKTTYLAGAGLEFVRVLGLGAYGLVALFRAKNQAGEVRHVVAKMCILAKNSLKNEKTHLEELVGAPHCTQLFSLRDFHGPLSSLPPDLQADIDGNPNLVLLEHARYGDLYSALCKLQATGQRFPDKLQWRIWECLVKAVIEIEYPPATQSAARRKTAAGSAPIDYRDAGDKPSYMVHFDIHPTNVLILELDPISGLPRIQIGDFGVAETWTPQRAAQEYELAWEMRMRGRAPFAAPEQFTLEWQKFVLNPFNECRSVQDFVAGNYSWRTNLYQAALIMWCCITQFGPGNMPLALTASEASDKAMPPTYGGALLHGAPPPHGYGHVDTVLRRIVARCMAHTPANRPSMRELVDDLEDARRRGRLPVPGIVDPELAAWCRAFFTPMPMDPRQDEDFCSSRTTHE